ncbi:MAG: Eco57I restriction-modification methylase domain-containing protein [Prevotellaceae bacterium]|jgi:superfamily II DNA or RNA helicase|nr:Eco57I restriction-modification methylase domain-containing protein [Prevotellaceae bacterium]
MLKINALQQKFIYIYQHIDVAGHNGWLKVGETTRDAQGRVRAQNEADNVRAQILWTTQAIRNNGQTFSDKEIHRLLETKGVEREKKHNTQTNRDSEWFKIDIEPLKQYILDYKNCIVNNEETGEIVSFMLRKEQQEAVDVTKEYWEKCQTKTDIQPEFLWNAKPRFGKTLTSYEFAKSIGAKRILIVTNRPAISDSWYADFKKFIKPSTDYIFASSESVARNNREILTRTDILTQNLVRENLIYFISLQDIKGQSRESELSAVNEYKQRNQWLFELKAPWDLLIIDESHEGVDTSKSFHVLTNLNYNFALHLSGTPFKAIQTAKFNGSQIYNWSYSDEQNAKANWNILDGDNPYAILPKLNVFTYQLSRALELSAEQAKDEGSEYAFDLGEFFRVVSNEFAYRAEVVKFLDHLCNPLFEYPFSKSEYLASLRHTFWLLPGVKECEQMKKLLNDHPFFKEYKVVMAAGSGDEDRITKTALEEVRRRISDNPLKTKTITLSCGQLTTGVTVPAWTAVMMLNNCKSPSLYMQSAFRSQNPFEFAGQMKTDCFVFDFAPDRILQTIADFADNMHANSAEPRELKVKTLLNFLPVIAQDDEGKMKELDANEVLTIPLKLITQEVVNRGFMSNRLFENIAGIFGAPKTVMEILQKLKPEENKRLGNPAVNKPSGKVKIWLDANKKIHIGEDIVVNTSNGLLGNKKYAVEGSDEAIEVQQILTDTKIEMQKEGFPQQSQQIILRELEKKMPAIVAKEPTQKEIEDFPSPEQPDDKPTRSEKTEEEKVRDRLRGFTRTIPSFLMAYGNNNTTLVNFEQNIPDDTFKELTNITKEEFQQLRDGFEYQEEGEKRHFGGLFNSEVFNASIALFLNKKQELANYFESDGEDIFDYIPPQETNQIFTPKRVVKMIVDTLQGSHPELFESSETTFCDLYMKSGLFITEVVRRLFENTRAQYRNDHDCIRHILEKQVYGFAPTNILYHICINLIFGFDKNNISKKNFLNIDTTPYCKNKSLEIITNENNMKFDVIIGNPPYQENVGIEHESIAIPLYHLFIRQAKKLNPKYISFIVPSRWFTGGRGLDEFRDEMLRDDRLQIIVDYTDANDCFCGLNINGGVNYFLWNSNYKGQCEFTNICNGKRSTAFRNLNEFDILIRFNECVDIIHKVKKKHKKDMSDMISPQTPFGFLTNEYGNDTPSNNAVILHSSKGIGYVNKDEIKRNVDWVGKYKVIIGKAISGHAGEMDSNGQAKIIATIKLLNPNEICTQSYLVVGPSESKTEAENLLKYLKSKFVRFMMFPQMLSISISKQSFKFVPLQDFTESWTDAKLYKKYGITKEEIAFIESMIRPME